MTEQDQTDSINSIFLAAQRAYGIMALITDAYLDSISSDHVKYSLFAVQNELKHIIEAAEAIEYGGAE